MLDFNITCLGMIKNRSLPEQQSVVWEGVILRTGAVKELISRLVLLRPKDNKNCGFTTVPNHRQYQSVCADIAVNTGASPLAISCLRLLKVMVSLLFLIPGVCGSLLY